MLDERFPAVLEAVRRGDEEAFAILFRDVQPALLRYLEILASSVAEDLAAETWLDVVRSLPRFSGSEAGLRAWIVTVGRRRYIDWLRARARRPAETTIEEAEEPLCSEDDPAVTIEHDFSTEEALKLIGTLPPAQAEVLALRVVGGLDVESAAQVLGRQPGDVRVLTHRGLHRLAERCPTSLREMAVGRR